MSRRKVLLPDAPRLPFRFFLASPSVANMDMDQCILEIAGQALDRAHLVFAEQGDPDAFLVKWKGKEARHA